MSVKRGGSWCSVYGCRNNSNVNKNISFFRYPRNPERSKAWILATGRRDLLTKGTEYAYKNCRVCALHFESQMFANELKNRLHLHAVPKIVLSSNNDETEKPELTTLTPVKPEELIYQNIKEEPEPTDSTPSESENQFFNPIYIKEEYQEINPYQMLRSDFEIKAEDTSWETYYKTLENYQQENKIAHLNLDEYSMRNKRIYSKCNICTKKYLSCNFHEHVKSHEKLKTSHKIKLSNSLQIENDDKIYQFLS